MEYRTVYVNPARAEEGDIGGASRDFIVFPSMWTVSAESEIRAGRVRVSGGVHVVDRDRLETEIAGGASIYELDPRGQPVTGRTLRATFIEIIPVRRQSGTTYDFVEKRVIPVYEYTYDERTAGTARLSTDSNGQFSGSIPGANPEHDYRVELALTDPDGHVARGVADASDGIEMEQRSSGGFVSFTRDPSEGSEVAFGVGDEIDVTMRELGAGSSIDDDRHLFYVAQRGLRDVTVRDSSRFVTAFPDWGPPNIAIGAVRFTGAGYAVGQSLPAQFRETDRAIRVDVQPNKTRYAPGGTVTLNVRTRDAGGRALPATVVLSVIDEKLFTIDAATSHDPLQDLYAWVGDGIRATYGSHRAPRGRTGGADTGGGGDGDDFRDSVLFKAVDTGADGRASVTFDLSDDLTSWHVSAARHRGRPRGRRRLDADPRRATVLRGCCDRAGVPARGSPVDQIRAFGSALDPDARVTFTVDGDSLGLHESGLRADAFEAITVPLPALKLGTHSITISGVTGSGDAARRYKVTRTFSVVPSRLTRTQTSYAELSGRIGVTGGTGFTDVVVSDASSGRELPALLDLASTSSARLESALAAELATSLVTDRFGESPIQPWAATFDGSDYQREDGGIALLPYASSDLEVSSLAALVAPDQFNRNALKAYFVTIGDSPLETRERRTFALAGLAGLGAPVIPDLNAAAADPTLTIRERLMLGLGAARLGDAQTGRAVLTSLVQAYGEAVADQARLRVGADGSDVTEATALTAMLMAAVGDPAASRYRAYVDANPSAEALGALHKVGYVTWVLDHRAPQSGSFAYDVDGTRRVVDLATGETFRLRLTKAQLPSFSIEPIGGSIGVTTIWRDPTDPTTLERDPDIEITRAVKPAGAIEAHDFVIVDLRVTFSPTASAGCHRVTELLPSGLVPVGVLRGVVDPDTGEPMSDVTYPEEQAGQRIVFCAEPPPGSRTAHLRYVARVITTGTYAWEPTLVESRSATDRAAIVPASRVTIR